jgi:hypothetical protein
MGPFLSKSRNGVSCNSRGRCSENQLDQNLRMHFVDNGSNRRNSSVDIKMIKIYTERRRSNRKDVCRRDLDS